MKTEFFGKYLAEIQIKEGCSVSNLMSLLVTLVVFNLSKAKSMPQKQIWEVGMWWGGRAGRGGWSSVDFQDLPVMCCKSHLVQDEATNLTIKVLPSDRNEVLRLPQLNKSYLDS